MCRSQVWQHKYIMYLASWVNPFAKRLYRFPETLKMYVSILKKQQKRGTAISAAPLCSI